MKTIRPATPSVSLLWFALLLCGCVRFHPQPLSPSKTAAILESRSLTNSDLKVFIENSERRELTNWPGISWNLRLLTDAAFYYQPSLAVARADWLMAQGGVRTAAARPNPSITVTPAYDPVPAPSPWIVPATIDVPLETAGKRRRRIEQAHFLSESARLHFATAAWTVRANVRNALLAFTAARQSAELLQAQAGWQQELGDRLQEQARLGAAAAQSKRGADRGSQGATRSGGRPFHGAAIQSHR
ncbi:MAG TPA: TolC family protein [Verrucomicrobiae bacterium]|nr:TolC family protein [Verrucomicrobiae bacterium]